MIWSKPWYPNVARCTASRYIHAAAVNDAMDAECEAEFRFQCVVMLREMLEETASDIAQPDHRQPDSLQPGLTFGN